MSKQQEDPETKKRRDIKNNNNKKGRRKTRFSTVAAARFELWNHSKFRKGVELRERKPRPSIRLMTSGGYENWASFSEWSGGPSRPLPSKQRAPSLNFSRFSSGKTSPRSRPDRRDKQFIERLSPSARRAAVGPRKKNTNDDRNGAVDRRF